MANCNWVGNSERGDRTTLGMRRARSQQHPNQVRHSDKGKLITKPAFATVWIANGRGRPACAGETTQTIPLKRKDVRATRIGGVDSETQRQSVAPARRDPRAMVRFHRVAGWPSRCDSCPIHCSIVEIRKLQRRPEGCWYYLARLTRAC